MRRLWQSIWSMQLYQTKFFEHFQNSTESVTSSKFRLSPPEEIKIWYISSINQTLRWNSHILINIWILQQTCWFPTDSWIGVFASSLEPNKRVQDANPAVLPSWNQGSINALFCLDAYSPCFRHQEVWEPFCTGWLISWLFHSFVSWSYHSVFAVGHSIICK